MASNKSLAQTFKKSALAATMGIIAVSTANAGSVAGTGGATEVTQILNNSELVVQSTQLYQQVQQTLLQVQMMQKNLLKSPLNLWGQTQQDLIQLTQLVNQTQAIGYAAANVDQQFREAFPGFAKSAGNTNYGTKYKDLMMKAMGGLNSALQISGMNINQFTSERNAISQIQSMSESSEGALQAVQAGNMIASQTVDQLQKMRQLIATQAMAQSNYLGMQAQAQADQTDAAQTVLRQGNGKVRKWGETGFVKF